MAKGLGAIMAAVAASQKEEELNKEGTVVCPFCGQPMQESVAWFCYSDPSTGKCPVIPMLEDAYGSADRLQGEVIGAVVVDGRPVVKFIAVRGGRGLTNLKVSPVKYGDEASVPGLIREHRWTWDDRIYHIVLPQYR